MRALTTPLAIAVAGSALAPVAASAADRYYVYGRGFGHGVGMSQYGADGYARHGWTYDQILRHYYQGTSLGSTSPSLRVRVLLGTGRSAVHVSHVRSAGGTAVAPSRGYTIVATSGNRVTVKNPSGKVIRRATAGVTLVGSAGWARLRDRTMNGVLGGFRGSLRVERGAGGLRIVNVLGIDSYVRGVVAGEMPSSWHPEALKVQATAARSYAYATGAATRELYPDTRSQVYRGMSGEATSSNAAVSATRGKIVTYRGAPIVTYYFSTSGGRTENGENIFGGAPAPYLRSVVDEYDVISPMHFWTIRSTTTSIGSRLGVGRLIAIKVLKRGASPRILSARVRGTRGVRVMTGRTMRARLGARDSWMRFKKITSTVTPMVGGAAASISPVRVSQRKLVLSGVVAPAKRGTVLVIERRSGSTWELQGTTRVGAGGAYRWTGPGAGTYRVKAGVFAGPSVRLG
jgi:stage II sporulation protein D